MKKKIEELLEGKQIQPLGVKELIKELDSVLMMRNEVKKPVGSMAEIPKEVKPKVVEKIVEVEKVVEVEKIVEVEKVVEVEKQEFSKEEILELVQKECNKE